MGKMTAGRVGSTRAGGVALFSPGVREDGPLPEGDRGLKEMREEPGKELPHMEGAAGDRFWDKSLGAEVEERWSGGDRPIGSDSQGELMGRRVGNRLRWGGGE